MQVAIVVVAGCFELFIVFSQFLAAKVQFEYDFGELVKFRLAFDSVFLNYGLGCFVRVAQIVCGCRCRC